MDSSDSTTDDNRHVCSPLKQETAEVTTTSSAAIITGKCHVGRANVNTTERSSEHDRMDLTTSGEQGNNGDNMEEDDEEQQPDEEEEDDDDEYKQSSEEGGEDGDDNILALMEDLAESSEHNKKDLTTCEQENSDNVEEDDDEQKDEGAEESEDDDDLLVKIEDLGPDGDEEDDESYFQTGSEDDDDDDDDEDYSAMPTTSSAIFSPLKMLRKAANSGDMKNTHELMNLAFGSADGIPDLNKEQSKPIASGDEVGTETSEKLENAKTSKFWNELYMSLIEDILRALEVELGKNKEKQKALEEKIVIQRSKNSGKNRMRPNEFYRSDDGTNKGNENKMRLTVFHKPYFRSADGTPPSNDHTKLLKSWHHQNISRNKPWTKKEHELLENAIHESAWEITLRPFMSKIELYTEKLLASNNPDMIEVLKEKVLQAKQEMNAAEERDIEDIICEMDGDKLDWMRISSLTFNGERSEFQCQLMWRNWLHPDVNKKPWAWEETKQLGELVEQHGRHQWKRIAEELGTNRTPMHCLQHYRRRLDSFAKREWTEEEDMILEEVIENCRIGNRIPWNQVSFYMEGRSSGACAKRWHQLDPSIKHGRWTVEEDALLVMGVNILGSLKWQHVAQLVPGRTVNQCRERWINCLDPNLKTQIFSYEEDKILLKYIEKKGASSWSTIATFLPGRTDQQCLAQYNRLKKWENQDKFVKGQSNESKSYFLRKFNVCDYADQIEAGKSLDDLLPLPSNKSDDENVWLWQQENLKRDLVKQELDSRKGEMYVPRPPLLKRYTTSTLIRLWNKRNTLRQRIESFINKQLVSEGQQKSKEDLQKGTYTRVSSKLDLLKPNVSVSDMLRIARDIGVNSKGKTAYKTGAENKKRMICNVDQQIKDMMYLPWLRDNQVKRLKTFHDRLEEGSDVERMKRKLHVLGLYMKVLDIKPSMYQSVKKKKSGNYMKATNYINGEEKKRFNQMFLDAYQTNKVNLSPELVEQVEGGHTVPPNLTTVNAFRLMLQEKQKLQKTCVDYDKKKGNIPLKIVKETPEYFLLQKRFYSLFTWPAFLSTLERSKKQLQDTKNKCQVDPSKKKIRKKYPMTSAKRYMKHFIKERTKNAKKRKANTMELSYTDQSDQDMSTRVGTNLETEKETTPSTTCKIKKFKKSPLIESTDQVPTQKRRLGRPVGAKSTRKTVDLTPVRTSRRQQQKRLGSSCSPSCSFNPKSLLDIDKTEEISAPSPALCDTPIGQNYGPVINPAPSASAVISEPFKTNLLSNLSPGLIQQVISHEVQVKPIGTYIRLNPKTTE